MVNLSIDLDSNSSNCTPPPRLVSSSSEYEYDNDIEGGYSSSSDNSSSCSSSSLLSSQSRSPTEERIVSKSISLGRFTRRRSLTMNLSHRRAAAAAVEQQQRQQQQRQGSSQSSSTSQKMIPMAPKSTPVSFYYKPAPPKTIQIHTTASSVSYCQDRSKSKRLPIKAAHFSTKMTTLLLPLLLLLSALGTILFYRQHQAHQQELHSLQSQLLLATNSRTRIQQVHAQSIQELLESSQAAKSLKHTLDKMTKVNAEMSQNIQRLQEEHKDGKEHVQASGVKVDIMEKKVKVVQDRLDSIVKGIQDKSRMAVLDKYGPGPHFVEMRVQLPTANDNDIDGSSSSSIRTIKIEMAPLDVMPHAVHTFLEQVDGKAWDGTHFDLHAGHVLLARNNNDSSNTDNNSDINNNNNNENKNKKQVPVISFPEYSTSYPHDRYTVAFPGRPNTGQDFYINLIPNTPYHSPRTKQDGTFIEGEPCFGTIVEEGDSRKVVGEMDALSLKKSGVLERPVVILDAKIVVS